MNFETFWNIIKNNNGIELLTLSQKKPFLFKFDNSNDSIQIIPNSKDPRSTNRIKFQEIWNIAKKSTTPFIPSQYAQITFNSSYLVAIMKHILKNEKIE